MEPHKKSLKTQITCKKIKYFIIRYFNKQTVITELKNDSLVLVFLENLAATFRIWSSGEKNPFLKYVSPIF